MGIHAMGENESGEDGAEISKKEKEKELDNGHAGQNKETGGNKQLAIQEERNLNTEATFLYDSLLGQIDELLGIFPHSPLSTEGVR